MTINKHYSGIVKTFNGEFFRSWDTPHGALITKPTMKGLYVLVIVTDEYKGSIPNKKVQSNWGKYVAEALENKWGGK
jgi:hypothetical protein